MKEKYSYNVHLNLDISLRGDDKTGMIDSALKGIKSALGSVMGGTSKGIFIGTNDEDERDTKNEYRVEILPDSTCCDMYSHTLEARIDEMRQFVEALDDKYVYIRTCRNDVSLEGMVIPAVFTGIIKTCYIEINRVDSTSYNFRLDCKTTDILPKREEEYLLSQRFDKIEDAYNFVVKWAENINSVLRH